MKTMKLPTFIHTSAIMIAFAFTMLSSIALADSPTRIGVATRTNSGNNIIRVYDGQDVLVGDVPVASEFLNARFIVADFIPDSLASVVALVEDENGRLRGSFINDQGVVVNRIFLGGNINTLMAIYYDGDSTADLAVIQGIGNSQTATVYLRPALNGGNETIEVPLGGRRDIVRLFMPGTDEVGTVSRVDSLSPSKKRKKQQKRLKRRLRKLNKKLKRFQRKNNNGRFDKRITKVSGQIASTESRLGGANSIQYVDRTGAQQSLSIDADPGKFLSFANGNDLGFVKVKNKRVEIFGNGLPTTVLEKQIADRVFTGDYLGNGNTAVVITGDDGTYRVIDPKTGTVSVREIDITAPSNAPEAPSPEPDEDEDDDDSGPNPGDEEACNRYTALYQEFLAAIDNNEFQRATELSTQLNALRPTLPDNCDPGGGGFNPGGGGGSGGGSGGNDEPDTVFTNGVDRFVPQFYFFKSNTGDFFGICDRFLDAPDGLGGFLAKNSDGGGIVWLTPDSSYDGETGMILNFNSLTVRERSLRYTGLANGARGHFRLGGDLSDYGKHVFTAVERFSGERHCWKVNPKGRDRVD